VLLSADGNCRKISRLEAPLNSAGGGLGRFLKALRGQGVQEEGIDQLMRANPRALFA
jgi:predicted metal-dependent phosphotriesterase family hydrolase